MAKGEPTDSKTVAACLEEYRLAKQAQILARAPAGRPNTDIQRQARETLLAGIRPATKLEQNTP